MGKEGAVGKGLVNEGNRNERIGRKGKSAPPPSAGDDDDDDDDDADLI